MTALSRSVTPVTTSPIYAIVGKQAIRHRFEAGATQPTVTIGGSTEMLCGNSCVTKICKTSYIELAHNFMFFINIKQH